MNIPKDFNVHDRPSPVTDPWQPLFARCSETTCDIGFVLDKQHCNGRGMLHGGVIAALADNAMGLSLGRAWMTQMLANDDIKPSIITTNLSVDYLNVAKLGQWICIQPRVIHIGSKSGTVDAIISANDIAIARANATFRLLV